MRRVNRHRAPFGRRIVRHARRAAPHFVVGLLLVDMVLCAGFLGSAVGVWNAGNHDRALLLLEYAAAPAGAAVLLFILYAYLKGPTR